MTERAASVSTRFAALLEATLEERSWTKQDLAARIPVSRGAIYNWLHGDVPSADMCFNIAHALDVNPLRILEACNYAPGVSGLLDLIDQLQAHQEQLLAIRTRVNTDRSQSGLGLVIDEFARSGSFSFQVAPWWRGTGESRRHYADLVVVEPPDGDPTSQGELEDKFGEVLTLAMSWWEGPENWAQVLEGLDMRSRHDLVLNVPRFVNNRRAGGNTLLNTPPTIVLIGGHWCGQAEAGRFLAELLDCDYALPSLAASVMHKTLVQRWSEPSWDRNRLDLIRTFALGTPVSRRRVWAVDYWDDADGVKLVTSAPNVPYVVFLNPTDTLLEYAADRRLQDGHARDGRSRSEDLAVLRRVRADAMSHASTLRPDQLMVVDVDVIEGAWDDRVRRGVALPAVDAWFDHFAGLAEVIRSRLPHREPT
jgi:transcriptional regulator with XRE-family HTH domain